MGYVGKNTFQLFFLNFEKLRNYVWIEKQMKLENLVEES
jgi:hypothetical protein